jgi:hypothetical protein
VVEEVEEVIRVRKGMTRAACGRDSGGGGGYIMGSEHISDRI